MRLKRTAAGLVVLLTATLQAETVDITGRITTTFSGLSVENVEVSLVNHGVTVWTDTGGRYAFQYTPTLRRPAAHTAASVLKLRGSSLFLTLANKRLVRIDLFTMGGKCVRTVVNRTLQPGSHSFRLSGLSSQMYLILLSVDGVSTLHRYLHLPGMNGARLTSENGSMLPVTAAGRGTAKLAPAVDTIKVFKEGYLRTQFPIETYTGVYDFYLDTVCAIIMVSVIEDSTYNPIENANVVIYDANTNNGIDRAFSDASGTCMLFVPANLTYYLKASAQNYINSPPPSGSPQPFPVGDSGSFDFSEVILKKNENASSCGAVTGYVLSTLSAPVPGALVIAIRQSDSIYLTGLSGPDGLYVMYNVPQGAYEMQACLAGWYQATPLTGVTVDSQVVTSGVNITLTADTGTSLSGRITFLAATNAEVDVTLTHIISNEAIPGLNTMTVSQNYVMDSIPPGTYVPWASYKNDGYVMDPDWIQKFGLPVLTFPLGGGPQTLNFSVTDAITIISPTNHPDTIVPRAITTDTPTFVWTSYPSTQEYVIAVYNNFGDVIWGGYDSLGNILHAKIDARDTSAVFNFDGSATEPLQWGNDSRYQYRWKIWADKGNQAGVQQFISSSEDLMGLFILSQP